MQPERVRATRPERVRRFRKRRPTVANLYCLLCDEAPAVDDLGYCAVCRWVVRAEIEDGWFHLRIYLRKWANFRDWELAHPAAESSPIT